MITTIFTIINTNFKILSRQRSLIISSLGLAVISMLVFGWLFSGSGSIKTVLGVVDEDHSTISQQILGQLQKSEALQIYTGTYPNEQQALLDGQRDAVIVMPAGFGEQTTRGTAHMKVLYDQSNPISTATTQLTVQAIVDGVNRSATHQPGPVTLDQQGLSVKNLRTIDFVTPGMLGMLLMWANLAVGGELVFWKHAGITRRLAATPLRPLGMLSAQVTARLALSLLQGAILLALAIWIFNVHIYGNYGLLLLTITLGALTMLAIGFAVASFVKKPETASAITLLISFPMTFLSGSYFNVNGAPTFIQPLIHAMPLYYLNDALRQIINNGADWASLQPSILVLAAWILASLLIVWRGFKWL
ncbi:MAG TPA: ABC transporter permease [Ktedonobacteraceae bacterium]|nr:ABC transporter permease [Ktedonobacteraceae bacterium]